MEARGHSSPARDCNHAAGAGDRWSAKLPWHELQYCHSKFGRLPATIAGRNPAFTFHLGARVPRFGDKHRFLPRHADVQAADGRTNRHSSSWTTFSRSREVIPRDFAGIPEPDTRDIICNKARGFYGLN